jgi:hypothetical protein
MTTNTVLSADWLAAILASLGSTGDEVARTLRKAGATGIPADILNDPVAHYVRTWARGLTPPESIVEVVVTAEEVVVSSTTSSDGPDDHREITADTPGPVEDFLDRFDAREDYQDLARDRSPQTASMPPA